MSFNIIATLILFGLLPGEGYQIVDMRLREKSLEQSQLKA